MAQFLPSLTPAIDDNGSPVASAVWEFYAEGTTTPQQLVNVATSVTADTSGVFPAIELQSALSYRAVLKSSAGKVLFEIGFVDARLFDAGVKAALDASGNTVAGAVWRFYETGTTTPLSVYAEQALETELGSTVSANAAGVFPEIYLDTSNTYKAELVINGSVDTTIDPVTDANMATYIAGGDVAFDLLPTARIVGVVVDQTDCRVPYEVVDAGETFDVEVQAASPYGISSVTVKVTDSAAYSETASQSWTEQVRSRFQDTAVINNTQWDANRSGGTRGGLGVYAFPFAANSFADGLLTIEMTTVPMQGTVRTETWQIWNNAGSSKTVTNYYLDAASGNDTTGDGSSGNPWQTLAKVRSEYDTSHIVNVFLKAGTYTAFQQVGGYKAADVPVRVTTDTGVARADVTLTQASGFTRSRMQRYCYENITYDISDGSTSTEYFDQKTASDPMQDVILRNCEFKHPLGRAGQISGRTNNWGTGVAGSFTWPNAQFKVWNIGTTYTDFRGQILMRGLWRNCSITDRENDCFKEAEVVFGCYAEDNGDDLYVLKFSNFSGSVPVATNTFEDDAQEGAEGPGTVQSAVADGTTLLVYVDSATEQPWTYWKAFADGDPFTFSNGATATFAPSHSDFTQNDIGGSTSYDGNVLVYANVGYDMAGQGLFGKNLQSSAYVLNRLAMGEKSNFGVAFSQLQDARGHSVLLNSDPHHPFQFVLANQNPDMTIEHNMVAGNCFRDGDGAGQSETGNGVTSEYNRWADATYVTSGTNSSGDPGMVDFDYTLEDPADGTNRDLKPDTGSALIGMVPTGVSRPAWDTFLYDALGRTRNGEAGALAA